MSGKRAPLVAAIDLGNDRFKALAAPGRRGRRPSGCGKW